MFTIFGFRRFLAVSTAVGLVMPVWPAVAQDDSGGSPPGRVGRIEQVSGGVSFNGAGSGGWAAAEANYPVSAGDSIYTQGDGLAVVGVDASHVALAAGTEVQVTGLDETRMGVTVAQGEVFLDIAGLAEGESFVVATPRGTVTIAQDGKYGVVAGDAGDPTLVDVFYGAAAVTGPGVDLAVGAGQSGVLTGDDPAVGQLMAVRPDAFARGELGAADEVAPPDYVPPVVGEMTGGYQLAGYGDWTQDPDYGAVWYPRVGDGWAPYREGRWADVSPWGWTWVDNDPWGFAPFHYGRWLDHGGRWGWLPLDRAAYRGEEYRPVYAPALVTFFGLGAGVGLAVGAFGGRSVGWVPLGPGEIFRPYYRTNDDYDRRVNQYYVRDVTHVNFHETVNVNHIKYVNERGATSIDQDAMRRGDPVARAGHEVRPEMLAAGRPVGAYFALPRAAAPLAHEHPGVAPRPTSFAERHEVAPGLQPDHRLAPRQPGMRPPEGRPPEGRPPENRPDFGANPGYHPPPPPPGQDLRPKPGNPEHSEPTNPSRPAMPQVYRPDDQNSGPRPAENRPPANLPRVYEPNDQNNGIYHPENPRPANLPQVFHPQNQQPVFHPENQPRPPEPPFHPPQPEYHPPTPQYHPAMEQPHVNPPPPQPRFNPPPPAPRPEPPPPPHENKKPGQP